MIETPKSEAPVVAEPTPEVTETTERRSRWQLGRVRDYGIVTTFLLIFVALSISSPAFLTTTNMLNLLEQNATIGIVACGGTLVIIAGGFDLSAGAIFAFAAVVAAEVAVHVNPTLGLIAGVIVGLILGMINGFIVTKMRINTFIATLATSYVYRGVATLITGGFLVNVAATSFAVPGTYKFFDVKFTIWIFAFVAVGLGFLLAKTAYGRHVYAVGGNSEAARLSGIPVDRVFAMTFAISGVCAGLAGVLAASQDATGSARAGIGIELASVAAIVIGGTSIAGGEGAIWRSVLGVMLLALINNGFNLLDIDPFYQSVVQGLIILIAVGVDVWARKDAVRSG